MLGALFDTNILIDYLNGIEKARHEFACYERRAISAITWMEVLVGATPDTEAALRAWLKTFELVQIDEPIAARAVAIRRKRKIRLPDAIVWASAQVEGLLLVTRNAKDFPPDEPGVRMPYVLA